MPTLREADPLEAVEAWTGAIRRDPRDAGAWRGRGRALAALGEFARASEDFAEALRLDPSPSIRLRRGVDYLRMGEPGLAIAELTLALILDPGLVEAVERRAEAFRALGDRARAALDDRQARRLKRAVRARLVAEASQPDPREVPLKTA